MPRGIDSGRHPKRQVSREVWYTKPDGGSALKPNAHSSEQDWADYREAAQYFEKNKGKNKTQPFDPYLNTWA